jgi:hypothetical protein
MISPKVFVSRPTVLTSSQAAEHQRWLRSLAAVGFDAIALQRGDYGPLPWDQLRDAIGGAHGGLVLGFRQMWVESGCSRPRTSEAAPAADWYATPWNQLEAGLAIMAGVPVLVAPEAGVVDGVFARDVWTGNVRGVAIDSSVNGPNAESDPAREIFQTWARAVRRRAAAKVRSSR